MYLSILLFEMFTNLFPKIISLLLFVIEIARLKELKAKLKNLILYLLAFSM